MTVTEKLRLELEDIGTFLPAGWVWLAPYKIAEPDAYLFSAERAGCSFERVTRLVPFGCGLGALTRALFAIAHDASARDVQEWYPR